MVELEIDDKKLEKEKEARRRKLIKEKRLKELKEKQEKLKLEKKPKEKKSKQSKFLQKIVKKTWFIPTASIIILIFVALLLKKPVDIYIESVHNETAIKDYQVEMKNIIGYDVDAAIQELKNNEISYNIIEVEDLYALTGNVIKTSSDAGEYINKEIPIDVYVCNNHDGNQLNTNTITTEPTPFLKNSISVMSFDVIEDDFFIVIQNKNNATLKDIAYTIGYADKSGKAIGSKTYKEFNINVLAGQKYELRNKIKCHNSAYLVVENIVCTTIY